MGALEGYNTPNDVDVKHLLYDKVRALIDRFEAEKGTIICRELLGLEKGQFEPVPAVRTSEYYTKRPCADLVYTAAEIVEKAYFK